VGSSAAVVVRPAAAGHTPRCKAFIRARRKANSVFEIVAVVACLALLDRANRVIFPTEPLAVETATQYATAFVAVAAAATEVHGNIVTGGDLRWFTGAHPVATR
jgi:hypothetical protein